jgi:hypothetical protein
MRAIKIDAHNRKITEIDIDGLDDMQKAVGGLIEPAFYYPDGSCCMVNEEGLLNGIDMFFQSKYGEHPFAGDGLIVGATDDEGETLPCSLDIDLVRKSTCFMDLPTLQLYLALNEDK